MKDEKQKCRYALCITYNNNNNKYPINQITELINSHIICAINQRGETYHMSMRQASLYVFNIYVLI